VQKEKGEKETATSERSQTKSCEVDNFTLFAKNNTKSHPHIHKRAKVKTDVQKYPLQKIHSSIL